MTELDLDRIKQITADLDDDTIEDSTWVQRAIRVVAQVPRMIAEIERLRRLLGEPFPTSAAYENAIQALADERARADLAEQERDRLAAELAWISGGNR